MAKHQHIEIRGARVNNLKNVSLDIPRDALTVITGLSGSGKSSLAFDTLYAEANRRYMESISSYARNFMETLAKADVDSLTHLSPAIAIDQKSISRSPRSTVGTLTEVYDYIRVLFAKVGIPHCFKCGRELHRKSAQEILEEILALPDNSRLVFLAKLSQTQKKTEKEALKHVEQLGYARVRFHGQIMLSNEAVPHASDMLLSELEVVVDRMALDTTRPDRERLLDSIETAFKLGRGALTILIDHNEERWYNQEYLCQDCGVRLPELAPNIFSFNSPEGACQVCSGLGIKLELDPELLIPNKNLSLSEGAVRPWSKTNDNRETKVGQLGLLQEFALRQKFSLDVPVKKILAKHFKALLYGELNGHGGNGKTRKSDLFPGIIPLLEKKYRETKSDHLRSEIEKYMLVKKCPECQGKRLTPEALAVTVDGRSIDTVTALSVKALREYFKKLLHSEAARQSKDVVSALVKEMELRLEAVEKVGLGYLELSRSAQTLSGGEAQRIKLAIQMKSDLTGILYVLDEPSVGLHNRDTEKLIQALQTLKENGNSLVVVEHDPSIMRAADWIVDMGPGAGREGGKMIFAGPPKKLWASKFLTGQYLSGRLTITPKGKVRRKPKRFLKILGASEHNLKNIDVAIPLETFVAVAGVSGSGKSTLIDDILARYLIRHFYKAKVTVGKHRSIVGLEQIDKVIVVSQDPIGRTPRSNAATYTGIFTPIRELFAATLEARKEIFTASHFSFNMRGGRCEVCQGGGLRKVEMYLLPDMYVACEACQGTRYNQKTLAIEFRGLNVSQILSMTVTEAAGVFSDQPLIQEKLKTLEEVGLGYLVLGQSATNLSGGEAQRIKLATELARKSTGKTLYILDEPTIGLHFEDTRRLLEVLDALVDKGNSVLVVEHNTDVIRHADWVIDMGPEGGAEGGTIVFEGVPDKLKACKKSFTGQYL